MNIARRKGRDDGAGHEHQQRKYRGRKFRMQAGLGSGRNPPQQGIEARDHDEMQAVEPAMMKLMTIPISRPA
jgi:hypothetical protein